MRYEIKHALRGRIAIFCCIILVLFCMLVFVQMENSHALFQSEMSRSYALAAVTNISYRDGTDNMLKLFEERLTPKDQMIRENIYACYTWKIQTYQALSGLYAEAEADQMEARLEVERLELLLQAVQMDETAHQGRTTAAFFKEAFHDELLAHRSPLGLDELPFDSEVLGEKISVLPSRYTDEVNAHRYYYVLQSIRLYFLNTLNGVQAVSMNDTSPWAFIGILFGQTHLFTLFLTILVIVIAAGMVISARNSRSLQLVGVRPKGKFAILLHYWQASIVVSLSIIASVLGVFILLCGMLHGFEGLTSSLFVYSGSFSSVVPYAHYQRSTALGLSLLYDVCNHPEFVLVSTELHPIALWQLLLYASTIGLVYTLLLSLLGTVLALLPSKEWQPPFLLCAVCLILLATQNAPFASIWRQLSVSSPWLVVLGGETRTWLGSLLLGLMSIVLLLPSSWMILRKRNL